jgi:hypothetical protein
MKPFEERIVQNAVRSSWVVLFLFVAMVCSGIALCFLGMKDPSTFSFMGLNLSSSQVGLFVIAMGIVVFILQKRFFEMLMNPDSILSLGSRISSVSNKIQKAKEVGSSVTHPAAADRTEVKARELNIKTVYTRVILQAGISFAVLAVSFAILFRGSDPKLAQIASGMIGVVIGYWLR